MRLSQARTILHHSRAYAEDVLAGRRLFDHALRLVTEEEQRNSSLDAQMANIAEAG
jgi:hypothetical protein